MAEVHGLPIIDHLIDIDEFQLKGQPYIYKELGLFNFLSRRGTVFRFQIHQSFGRLSPSDRHTVQYVTRHIRGMLFANIQRRTDLPQSQMDDVLRKLIAEAN